ncbi:MAG: acyl-CoA dehydrogenase family protein [Planctomycetes bacterium]|nr:acyl-CoA dehydrogenase family protein [Planctomycetota bacterium]
MANFFTDNDDLLFQFDFWNLGALAKLREDGFKEAGEFDYAPVDEADAVDNYRRTLEVVGDIAGDFIAPRAEDVDLEGHELGDGVVHYNPLVMENVKCLGDADLFGFTLPRRFGGLNMPTLVYSMANEIVSRADASLMNIFGLQGIAETINAFASEELKEKYLPRLITGEHTGAMALTEPDAGSDLQRVNLAAAEAPDGTWRLNGVKRFITNGCGNILLVLARSEPEETGGLGLSLFICERQKAIRVRHIEDKLGIHGSPTCELEFHDAVGYIVGERRRGLVTYTMALMNGARVGIASQSVGVAEAAYREARDYAHTRIPFGRAIETFPAVAALLVEMKMLVEASRSLTLDASRVMDLENVLLEKLEKGLIEGQEARDVKKKQRRFKRLAAFLTPVSKYYASEAAVKVTSDAIQVLGGSGYMRDYPVERYYRDARIMPIYEGTSQLQVVAAVRGVTSGVAEGYFEELDGDFQKPLGGLAKKLRAARTELAKCIACVKAAGSEYTDLYAGDLVDTATDILIGYHFLRQARTSHRKAVAARHFISRALRRIRMRTSNITSGDQNVIKHFRMLAGEPSAEE